MTLEKNCLIVSTTSFTFSYFCIWRALEGVRPQSANERRRPRGCLLCPESPVPGLRKRAAALSQDSRTISWFSCPLPRPSHVLGSCHKVRVGRPLQGSRSGLAGAVGKIHTHGSCHPDSHSDNPRTPTQQSWRARVPQSRDAPWDMTLTKVQSPLLPQDGLLQGTAVSQQLPGPGCQAPLHHHLQTQG